MQLGSITSIGVPSHMDITREDVELLVREPSFEMRARITEKITAGYNTGLFNEAETKLANEIFRLLLKDTHVKLRKLVATQLKTNPHVPHDVAIALAEDVAEVALPVLEHSPVLTEEDLIDLTRATQEVAKLQAVAKRESISKDLSLALLEKRELSVADILVRNKGAVIAEDGMEIILNTFEGETPLIETLVARGGLPYRIVEKLFSVVSDSLKQELTQTYRLNRTMAHDTVDTAREKAVLGLISPSTSQADISAIVEQMHRSDQLTDSVIMRALCSGDLRFFETALAKRAGVALSNARILLLDPGDLGFRALYNASGMAPGFYQAVGTLLKLALAETQFGSYRTADFGARMVEQVLDGGYHQTVHHMDTILTMIGYAIHEQPTYH